MSGVTQQASLDHLQRDAGKTQSDAETWRTFWTGEACSSAPQATLPADATLLVEDYLRYVQPWMPICDRYQLRRSTYLWSTGKQTPSPGAQTCLYAIFAVTLCQTDEHRPHRRDEAAKWATRAAQGFSNPKDFPEATCVQMQILLALYHMASGSLVQSWLMLGRASRTALLLQDQKQQKSDADATPFASSGRWRHVVLACFVLDSILSTALKLPPTMLAMHLSRAFILSEDDSEEWDPGLPIEPASGHSSANTPGFCISTFNRLVQVCKSLNLIVDNRPDTVGKAPSAAMQRQMLITSDEQQPDHLRFISIGRRPPRTPLLPQQMTTQLVELSALLLSFDHTTVDWYATQIVHQLGELSASYSATFSLRSLPILWRPLLLIVVSCMERLPRCPMVKSAIGKLQTFTAKAARLFPSYAEVDQRFTALMQETPAADTRREEPRPLPARATIEHQKPAQTGPQYDFIAQAQMFRAVDANAGASSVTRSSSTTHTQPYGLPPKASNIATSDQIDVNDLWAMDAQDWGDSWDQGLQNLGFAADAGSEEFRRLLGG